MRAFMTSIIDIVLYHHLGLGDHFTCNGLVHNLAEKYRTIYLVCKEKYYPTIKHLYEDFSHIQIVPIKNEPHDIIEFSNLKGLQILRVGFEFIDPLHVERSFYNQLNLPFDLRFSNFKLPTNLSNSKIFYEKIIRELGNDYIVVHNQSSDAIYELQVESTLPAHVCTMSDTNDILDYTHMLINAKEIHVINSAIYCLMVSLYKINLLRANKIVFHNNRSLLQGGNPPEVPSGIITKEYVTL